MNLLRLFLNPSNISKFVSNFINVVEHIFFKLIPIFCRNSFIFFMTVDLSFIHSNDVFHSFETIVDSEGLGGSSILEGEGKGLHNIEN